MDREPLERLTIRAVVFLGFGLILAIWVTAGYYSTRRIANVDEQAAVVTGRYMHAQDVLSTVRAQVLLGSVFVRDALLDPDPASVAEYRRRLERSHGIVESALSQYVPVLDTPRERDQIDELRRELADFRSTMLSVLTTDPHTWPSQARTLLRTRVVPRRERVVGLSEQAQALNRRIFVQQQSAIAAVYGVTQRHIWESLGLTLLASLGIAAFATVYAGRLEDRIRLQRAKEAQYTRDLQHLSSKLITAQEEERRSIARELHDEVGQVLTAIKVELAVAQREIEAGGGQAAVLADARTIAEGALQTVRDLSHLLHPALLDDLGLGEAVDWYLKGFAKRHGIRAELLRKGMDQRLAPETEASAYRIVQEALTNVARHAKATRCHVSLERLPNTILIAVEDDGIGFEVEAMEPSASRRGGLGLIGIRERAAQLRGYVRIESAEGKGTRLAVELPARPRRLSDADSADHVEGAAIPAAAHV